MGELGNLSRKGFEKAGVNYTLLYLLCLNGLGYVTECLERPLGPFFFLTNSLQVYIFIYHDIDKSVVFINTVIELLNQLSSAVQLRKKHM